MGQPLLFPTETERAPSPHGGVAIRSFRDFYAFESHVKTCRQQRGLEMVEQWYQQPVFYFSNAYSLIHSGDQVTAPAGCQELDYELELGVVIGRTGRDIPIEAAWDHVAGFTVINDFSARDLQRQEMQVGLGPSKGKDFATAVGPHLVPLDELNKRIDAKGNIDLEMSASVNGRQLSAGNTRQMYFTWPQIIAHASCGTTLYPGELLGSGTVGSGCILELGPDQTGGWLQSQDVIELQIEGIGALVNTVA